MIALEFLAAIAPLPLGLTAALLTAIALLPIHRATSAPSLVEIREASPPR